MFTECSLDVHWTFTDLSLNVHSTFPECAYTLMDADVGAKGGLDQGKVCASLVPFTECSLDVH
jgi:hypothetical protein